MSTYHITFECYLQKLFDVCMTASGHNGFTACKNIILNRWHLGTMEIFSRCCFHKYRQFFPIEGDFYHINISNLISILLFLSQKPIFSWHCQSLLFRFSCGNPSEALLFWVRFVTRSDYFVHPFDQFIKKKWFKETMWSQIEQDYQQTTCPSLSFSVVWNHK